MTQKNPFFAFLAAVGEALFVVLYFPFWWYSIGFVRFLRSLGRFLRARQENLALFVWVKNIFRPMYGQHDFSGRLISFFIRLIQICFRAVALIFYLILALMLAALWLALPIAVFTLITWQLS